LAPEYPLNLGGTPRIGSESERKGGCHLFGGRPTGWTALVNRALPEIEQARLQSSLQRGRPLGSEPWTRLTAERLGLQYTLNPRGRPKIEKDID
jgi:hypothetical protein